MKSYCHTKSTYLLSKINVKFSTIFHRGWFFHKNSFLKIFLSSWCFKSQRFFNTRREVRICFCRFLWYKLMLQRRKARCETNAKLMCSAVILAYIFPRRCRIQKQGRVEALLHSCQSPSVIHHSAPFIVIYRFLINGASVLSQKQKRNLNK